MLGNLSASQMESRLGIDFPKELKKLMENTHQAEAENIKSGKWHCFDMPFHLVCGDMDTAQKIYNYLKDQSSNCKEKLAISIQK